jgi:superfamily II DNA or RNA helicase
MLLNQINIKNPYIKKLIPEHLQSNFKDANKWLWMDENKKVLMNVVRAEESRLEYFKTSPITNIEEVFKTLSVTYKFLSDWDKDFMSDMVEHNNFSIKQKALILRIASSINYSMWKNNLSRSWLWNQIKEDVIIEQQVKEQYYDVEKVKEEELTDTTELIEQFEIVKNDFSDIMESKLYDHQILTVNFLMTRPDGCGIVASSTGCVDCDTEFFNGKKWKKISDYIEGDKVLQYNLDGTAELVEPLQYHKYKEEYLTEVKTIYGINQCVCDNHNFVIRDNNGNIKKVNSKDLIDNHNSNIAGYAKGKFIKTFSIKNDTKLNLTDAELRVMVAVIADGSFQESKVCKNKTKWCRINLKKQNKKDRIIKLLKNADIAYKEYNWNNKDKDYSNFILYAPIRTKVFTEEWYNCSKEQLEIIADEVLRWDGCYDRRNNLKSVGRFSTTVKENADFIQYVFTAIGFSASISTSDRRGRIKNIEGYDRDYITKSIDYNVQISNKKYTGFNTTTKKNFIKNYKTKDGYKYCFTVQSGMLILRRNDDINITGNSGKSIVGITYAEQLFLEKKIEHAYIICPLSMVETWKREIKKHSLKKDLSKYTILNYEKLLSFGFDNPENSLVITDETQKLKNNLSKRHKMFVKNKWKYVINLSATIIGNHIDELRSIYALMNKKAPIKYGKIDLSLLKKDLIKVSKDKLNLPAFIRKDIPIELNNYKEYNILKKDILSQIEMYKEYAIQQGKRPPNALVHLLRLNQYCSNRNIIMERAVPIEEQNKFKVMFEIIDGFDKDEQVIVWSNFVDSIKNIYDFLSEYFSCKMIYGETKQGHRDEILDSFRDGKFKVLIANPSTLSTGVTLVNSNKMIYFDRDFSMLKYVQAQGRINRIGQTRECTMYNLFYEDTIEEYVIDVLKTKEEMINEILENGTTIETFVGKEVMNKLLRW